MHLIHFTVFPFIIFHFGHLLWDNLIQCIYPEVKLVFFYLSKMQMYSKAKGNYLYHLENNNTKKNKREKRNSYNFRAYSHVS